MTDPLDAVVAPFAPTTRSQRDDALSPDSSAPAEWSGAPGTERRQGSTGPAVESLLALIVAIALALLVRTFVLQAYSIPSASMEDTLTTGDQVLVNQVSYAVGGISRGDVVVFDRPDDAPGDIPDLIKRVVGVGGDTIEGRDGHLWVNGLRLEEPYLSADEMTTDFGPTRIPVGHVFVMGDNREESYDSRFFGTIDADTIRGRAVVTYWPPSRWRGL